MKKIFVTLMLAGLCASPVISANNEMTAGRAAKIAGAAMVGGAVALGGLELLGRGAVKIGPKIGAWYQGSSLKKGLSALSKSVDAAIDSCANGLSRGAAVVDRGIAAIPNSLKAGARIGLCAGASYAATYRDISRQYGSYGDHDYVRTRAHWNGLFAGALYGTLWAVLELLMYSGEQEYKAKEAAAKAKVNADKAVEQQRRLEAERIARSRGSSSSNKESAKDRVGLFRD